MSKKSQKVIKTAESKLEILPAVQYGKEQYVLVKSLMPLPNNSRTMDTSRKNDVEALAADIKRYGLTEPLIVTCDLRIVIGGNRRLAACFENKMQDELIPVRPVLNDLSKHQILLLANHLNSQCRITGKPSTSTLVARCLEWIPSLPEEVQNRTMSIETLSSLTGLASADATKVWRAINKKLQDAYYKSDPKVASANAAKAVGSSVRHLFAAVAEINDRRQLQNAYGDIISLTKDIEYRLSRIAV